MASNETSELAYRVKCKTKTSRGISPGCRENHTLLIDQLYLMEAYCIRRSKALFPRELAKNVKRRVVTVREVNMNLESSKNLNIRVDCVCSGNGCRLFPSRGGELRTGVLGIESVITRASKTMSPKPMNIGSQTLRSIKNEAIGITVNWGTSVTAISWKKMMDLKSMSLLVICPRKEMPVLPLTLVHHISYHCHYHRTSNSTPTSNNIEGRREPSKFVVEGLWKITFLGKKDQLLCCSDHQVRGTHTDNHYPAVI